MTTRKTAALLTVLSALLIFLGAGGTVGALDKKEYKVYIVSDSTRIWAMDTQAGFKESLDRQLAAQGAKAVYTVFETKTDPAKAPDIVKAIQDDKPDLVLACNTPNGFTDSQITAKLTDPVYKFVSLDPIPVEIGLVKNWAHPGGNVTGVGVFLQFTSTIKLAQKINPKLKKVAFVTWDAMGKVNDWFESEMKQAALDTGVELVEFRRVANNEEELAFYQDYVPKAADTFVMPGISPYVRKDGSPMDPQRDWYSFVQKQLGKLLFVSYDDSTVANGLVAATAVVWTDIGAQLAEKAMKILQGTSPGDLPWEYPRKYNLIFNLQAAKDRGIAIPPALISSAYRVYTDYKGSFAGQKK
jgi:putative ABC transport system substrate-binding protein